MSQGQDEPEFPRGGKPAIPALERKRLREEGQAQARQDFLASGQGKRKKTDKQEEEDNDLLAFTREASKGRLPKFVELLKFKNLTIGAKIWGCILNISSKGLSLSLPDGLKGFVPIEETSDFMYELSLKSAKLEASGESSKRLPALQALFQEGQLVRATILALDQAPSGAKGVVRKKVTLSLRVAKLNGGVPADALTEGLALPACVKSVEDHGYTLDLGIKGAKAFLDKEGHNEGAGGSAPLVPGAVVEVIVVKAKDKRLIRVTTNRETVSGALTTEWKGLTIGSLLPGALVNVKVGKILADGLVISFLTYFHGTIDLFHLSKEGSQEDWKHQFKEGQKLRARVLLVDPTSKSITLSLLPHLLKMTPIDLPVNGSLIKKAVVQRVDDQLGVLLSLPGHVAGYAHISDIADEKVDKLAKVLQVGQEESARVIGSRLMDGLAVISLKPSAIEQFLMGGLQLGQQVKGKVVMADSKGLLININKDLNAFVPNEHISDLGEKQGKAKYKVGSAVTGKVLTVDPAKKRATLTLKQALVSSKLKPLTSWEDVKVGAKVQGIVTGFTSYGCFVRFFGDVKGLIHTSGLGLGPGKTPADAYEIGQVIKTRIQAFDPATRRMQLTLATKKADVAKETVRQIAREFQPGELWEAHVASIQSDADNRVSAYKVHLLENGAVIGSAQLDVPHLCDNVGAQEALQESIQVGSSLGNVMVLQRLRGSKVLLVTCKPSLIAAAEELPGELENLTEARIVPGYVANVIPEGVFVRFLSGLTGRAGLAQLSDTFVSDPQSVFSVGQSVRARIVEVNTGRKQFSVSLKQSVTGNNTGPYLASMLKSLDLAADIKAQAEAAAGEEAADWAQFAIGAAVQAIVHERKDYGVIVDLVDDPNLVGLIPLHQVGGDLEVGHEVTLRVLDVNKASGIVELTAKEDLLLGMQTTEQSKRGDKKKKKDKKSAFPEIGATVDTIVQMAKENYAIVSFGAAPKQLACVSVNDYNVRDNLTAQQLPISSKHKLVVALLPAPDSGNRIVMEFTPPKPGKEGKRPRREKNAAVAKINAGAILTGTIVETNPVFVVLELPEGMLGRIHATEASDDADKKGNPLSGWEIGQEVKGMVVGTWHESKRSAQNSIPCFELSAKPSMLSAKDTAAAIQKRLNASSLSYKNVYQGFVSHVATDYLIVAIAPQIAGRVFCLDASTKIGVLSHFKDNFKAGQPVRCRILKVDGKHHQIDLSLVQASGQMETSSVAAAQARPGDILIGKIVKGKGVGVRMQVGSHVYGTASLHELHDSWQDNALASLKEGAFVRCLVLEAAKTGKVSQRKKRKRGDGSDDADEQAASCLQLSLRPSRLSGKLPVDQNPLENLGLKDLKIGAEVKGYVKAASKYGVFVSLSNEVDARVKMSNLADSFVEDAAQAFPQGKLVKGHIISISQDKVEMSLKSKVSKKEQLEKLSEGQIVKGTVLRIKDFGIFVQLQNSSLVGFVHKSDLSDKFVKNISEAYTPGQGVRARVIELKLDEEKLKLGLKESYFVDVEDEAKPERKEAEVEADLDEEMLDAAEVDSDEDDWRNAALESPEIADEGSEDDEEASDEAHPSGDLDEAALLQLGKRRKPSKTSNSAGHSDNDEEEEEDAVSEGLDESSAESEEEEAEEDEDAEDELAADNVPILQSSGVGWGEETSEEVPAEPITEEPAGEEQELNKRQLKRQKKQREEAVRKAELARLEGSTQNNAADFERELMGSPNSSYLWIKYMAFQISLGEVDKARAIADQALQRIHYREEGEKFNIWQARLNLEMQYGDPPEQAVMKLFQRALSYTDQKKLYMALITLLERANQEEVLKQTYKAMHRKFPQSAKVWLRQIAYHQKKGDSEAARKMLQSATQSLPARKHIKVLRQAAFQAFSLGLPEQGRSIFEGLMRNYPKRLDLWNVYLDQEIKLNDSVRVRHLFERATSMQIPPKKMKFLFKRHLDYETKHGTAATVKKVKEAAKAYVAQHLASSS